MIETQNWAKPRSLPPDAVESVFGCLDHSSLKVLKVVNRAWNLRIAERLHSLCLNRPLQWPNKPQSPTTEKTCQIAQQMDRIPLAILTIPKEGPHPRRNTTSKHLEDIHSMTHKEFEDWCARGISSFPNVRNLDLIKPPYGGAVRLSDKDLRDIVCKVPKLRTLNITYWSEISDAGLGYIGQLLPCLKELEFIENHQISDAGLEAISSLPLETLELGLWTGESRITDIGLGHIAKMRFLKKLSLFRFQAITDAGISKLQKLPALRWLNIQDCDGITDVGLGALAKISSLKYLKIGTQIVGKQHSFTEAGVAQLKQLPALKSLSLYTDGHFISDSADARLKSLGLPLKTFLEFVMLRRKKGAVLFPILPRIVWGLILKAVIKGVTATRESQDPLQNEQQ